MFLSLYNQNIKVFLSESTGEVSGARASLGAVLNKAGIEVVFPQDGIPRAQTEELMLSCDCSVHVLGSLNIYDIDGSGSGTTAAEHYYMAKTVQKDGFKMFLWNPSGAINSRNLYINAIRRDIVENTIYSDCTSPIVFVEDLRSIMNVKSTVDENLTNADIFFIYNDLDRDSASEILSMLQDVQKVTSLSINMSGNINYNDFISSQLKVSRIVVIYCDSAADWAVPFVRQLWKDSGGKSAGVPLLLAGNVAHVKEAEISKIKDFMEYTICDKDVMPLEIKIFFDKEINNNNNN